MADNSIIWRPSDARAKSSKMYHFMRAHGFDNYESLHRWSIDAPAEFWPAVCETCDIRFFEPAHTVLARPANITNAGWFSGATLNFAAHMLRQTGTSEALVFCGENGRRQVLSHDQLRAAVARTAAALRADGVTTGDRVAGIMPNCPEAVIAMLATASLGAVWSSCSPDFGSSGILDRFGQIQPSVLFAPNGYYYNGKLCDIRATVAAVTASMPSLKRTVIVAFADELDTNIDGVNLCEWSSYGNDGQALRFEPVAFDHPLFILYSSGTTGVPKCIVHGHGGTLLQQSKEHVLHTDVSADDVLFYFTTCGWMMWNWLVAGLGTGATIVLFDGAPFLDNGNILWNIAEREQVSIFGTSAKYLSALEKAGVRPKDSHSLPALRSLLSTGSPLAPEGYDYVYDAIASDIQLASISGGTDILSCFALGNPLLPVRRGELQCKGLGMAVAVYDDAGNQVKEQHGELVCMKPFPSAPIEFWNDPNGSRYQSAYFERFPGVWAQGDLAEITSHDGVIIHGRSDAVLNPGGVRIGTAEIYRQVEKLPVVEESIAIGQRWEDDVRVVLFVVLRQGVSLSEALQEEIRDVIRRNTTPRHVPAIIVAVAEIPRTRSGKIVELAVRAVVHGEAVKNTDALANPEALRHYRDLPELRA